MEEKLKRMEELISILNAASDAYYNKNEIMSNFEYDQLYDELERLENETGTIMENSPTQNVGADVSESSKRPKVKHSKKAKSLDKTKDISEYVGAFTKGREVSPSHEDKTVLMWKMDGGTIVLTFRKGKLVKGVTRGNGEIGLDITENIKYIKGIPDSIPEMDEVIFRGEAVMSYSEFKRIKSTPEGEEYKNPRNLANSTLLQEESVIAEREIQFFAFNLAKHPNMPGKFCERLKTMENYGFQVVPYEVVSIENLPEIMDKWTENVKSWLYPVDGLVVAYEDAEFAESQPDTGHHPNQLVGYAFKWADETVETTFRKIEWSPSRTGLINPVAIFDPVDLCGTTVSRASVHNVSTLLNLDLKPGDTIKVYKANMIIPQISKNNDKSMKWDGIITDELYERNNLLRTCPVCGSTVTNEYTMANDKKTDTVVARCINEACPVKMTGRFTHFCERDCMNIDGISAATVEKFVTKGFIRSYTDFYHLDRFKEEIIAMEGFGEKSYENIIKAVENSRKIDLVSFLHSLSIPNVGKGQAKLIAKDCGNDVDVLIRKLLDNYDWTLIDGIGPVISSSLDSWADKYIRTCSVNPDIYYLLKEVIIEKGEETVSEQILEGKIFVITGSLEHFQNRDELKNKIESLGGKVTGSVTGKTSFLINNDVNSTSGKNKKAKELGVQIISEEEAMKMMEV